jgi:hypothetical protein
MMERLLCPNRQEEGDGSEKDKDGGSQRQQYPKPNIHRSIPTKSNGSMVACQ